MDAAGTSNTRSRPRVLFRVNAPVHAAFAPFWRRVVAYAVDCFLLFIGLLALQAALYVVNPIVAMQRAGVPFSGAQLHVWVFATATLPFLLYFAVAAASRQQATFGMRWLGMRIEHLDGSRLRFAAALVRAAVLLAPFEINHTVMFHAAPQPGASPDATFFIGIGFVWALLAVYVATMLLSKRRQSIHDLAARTVVVMPRCPDAPITR